MEKFKKNTRNREYYITVADNATKKTYQTFVVSAESVREAIKKAYHAVCGWQGVTPEDLR